MLTNHYNLQEFMKNKPLRGRLGCEWETLSSYNLDIVYRTGKTNSADGLSRRPDYKAAAEAEDCRKETERQPEANQSIEDAHSSAGESEEGREKVARISTAQLLGPWEQQLAATVRRWLPMASQGSPGNASRLFTTVVRLEEDRESSRDLSPSMREMIKGLLGQDESMRRFRAVYNLPKME